MSYKPNKIAVDYEKPYEEDRLDREKHVTNLSLLLHNISSPITLSINAPWGQGKTTFLEMLDIDLRKNKSQVIKFSAWETDFSEDPLLAFLGEINIALENLLSGNKKKNASLKKAMTIGGHILKRTIPVGAKLVTGGVLDVDKAFEGEAEKLTEKFTNDLINKYSEDKNHIDEFKQSVEKIVSDAVGENNKLFILIDELDRCRPTYAIELLERIKHLFDIDGLVFVLAMDGKQLSHSVKAIYGHEFDSTGYLRRFIDIEYKLPEPELNKFIFQLLKDFNLDEIFTRRSNMSRNQNYESEHFQQILNVFAKEQGFTLREVEQFIAKIKLVLLTTVEQEQLYVYLVVFLMMLKESHPEVYKEYIQDESSPESAINIFHTMIPENIRYKNHVCALLEGVLIKTKAEHSNTENDLFNSRRLEWKELTESENFDSKYGYLDTIMELAKLNGFKAPLKRLVNKIELSDSFNL